MKRSHWNPGGPSQDTFLNQDSRQCSLKSSSTQWLEIYFYSSFCSRVSCAFYSSLSSLDKYTIVQFSSCSPFADLGRSLHFKGSKHPSLFVSPFWTVKTATIRKFVLLGENFLLRAAEYKARLPPPQRRGKFVLAGFCFICFAWCRVLIQSCKKSPISCFYSNM